MVPESEKEQLRKAFSSTLSWIERRRSGSTVLKDSEFLDSLEKYATSSLRRLSTARYNREIGKLCKRADKLQAAVIFYVQRRLR